MLTWDDPKAEVDLHVISPDGGHAFFASPLLPEGGGLDVDSVDGAGPEIFSSAAPRPGVWLFYVIIGATSTPAATTSTAARTSAT